MNFSWWYWQWHLSSLCRLIGLWLTELDLGTSLDNLREIEKNNPQRPCSFLSASDPPSLSSPLLYSICWTCTHYTRSPIFPPSNQIHIWNRYIKPMATTAFQRWNIFWWESQLHYTPKPVRNLQGRSQDGVWTSSTRLEECSLNNTQQTRQAACSN